MHEANSHSKEVFLCVGLPRTGTTSIKVFLRSNKDLLLKHKIDFVDISASGKSVNTTVLKDKIINFSKGNSLLAFSELLTTNRKLLREVLNLISSDSTVNLTIILIRRDFESFSQSLYKQHVKYKRDVTFNHLFRECISSLKFIKKYRKKGRLKYLQIEYADTKEMCEVFIKEVFNLESKLGFVYQERSNVSSEKLKHSVNMARLERVLKANHNNNYFVRKWILEAFKVARGVGKTSDRKTQILSRLLVLINWKIMQKELLKIRIFKSRFENSFL